MPHSHSALVTLQCTRSDSAFASDGIAYRRSSIETQLLDDLSDRFIQSLSPIKMGSSVETLIP